MKKLAPPLLATGATIALLAYGAAQLTVSPRRAEARPARHCDVRTVVTAGSGSRSLVAVARHRVVAYRHGQPSATFPPVPRHLIVRPMPS